MTRILAAALLAALAAWPALRASASVVHLVSQRDRDFAVSRLEARVGDVVRFLNDDPFPHQVSLHGPRVRAESGLLVPGEPYEVRLPAAGRYEARCGIHPRMRLLIEAR